MFKKLLLAGAATALVASPAAARDWRYDGYRYHHGSGDAVTGALLGAVAGAALIGSLDNHRGYGYRSYGYSYPAYGYGYGYSYPAYSYSYPAYGYAYPSYGYSYPSYGYSYPSYGYSYPSYGYAYPGFATPSYGLSVNIGTGGYYNHYRPRYRRGW